MIKIKTRLHSYELAYAPIMQIAGQNVRVKNAMINALATFFSSGKKTENDWNSVESIHIKGEETGRKQFTVFRIRSIDDMISAIKLSKASMLSGYIKDLLSDYSCQEELEQIDNVLTSLFERINQSISEIGKVALSYSLEDIWEIVQKTSVVGSDERELNEMSNFELVCVYINLLRKRLEKRPERCLVLFENIDHLLEKEEYKNVILSASNITEDYDVHFLFTVSLDDYIVCDEGVIAGITICNDEVIPLPKIERIRDFIENNYPVYRSFSEGEIVHIIEPIVQRLYLSNFRLSVKSEIVLKLINETVFRKEKPENYSSPEIEYLYGGKEEIDAFLAHQSKSIARKEDLVF